MEISDTGWTIFELHWGNDLPIIDRDGNPIFQALLADLVVPSWFSWERAMAPFMIFTKGLANTAYHQVQARHAMVC